VRLSTTLERKDEALRLQTREVSSLKQRIEDLLQMTELQEVGEEGKERGRKC